MVPGQPTTLGRQSAPASPPPYLPHFPHLGKASVWPAIGSMGGERATVPVSGDNVVGRRKGQEAGPDPHFSGRGWPLRPTAGRLTSSRSRWLPGYGCFYLSALLPRGNSACTPCGAPSPTLRGRGGCPTPLLSWAQPTGLCNQHQATGWGCVWGSHEDLRL